MVKGMSAAMYLALVVTLAFVVLPSEAFSIGSPLRIVSGGRIAMKKSALTMQMFPIEGMNLKWPSFGGSQDSAYHKSREHYHLERIRYHQERAKYHREQMGQSSARTRTRSPDRQTRVLFVDLSNVCRSAAAEAALKALAEKRGKADKFVVASCSTGGGTADWFKPEVAQFIEMESADPRMTSHAIRRGYDTSGIKSKCMTKEDVKNFDIIVCMDMQNKREIIHAADYWGVADEAKRKIRLVTSYCRGTSSTEVPDPYYGGSGGGVSTGQVFERVLDMLEDGCQGLMRDVDQGLL